ncbi:uncharacterized protein LOC127243824 [Andrographis paniculata]|uniref:uncharacterized protein LOC127243824 n=1 Tax=Andrographis paniculata TaxID=175694 RepID=UPI0021E72D7B|nr:uncharacterized protein LOC127243824 [Andrographis paniculata]XP_051119965.1 uncharacterized protein LOC127243824 [Andrographis paniculata]XP_051119966.1 uncharacterized protein LOC127243824 [Andrographis paniculata]
MDASELETRTNSTSVAVEEEEEEEYVLLDLDGVSDHISIPPNAPYQLSGLDTPNPIMLIDNKIKLIGEYEETIGTCLVFNQSDGSPIVHQETGPSEASLFSGKYIIDPNETPAKQVSAVVSLHKILKFRLFSEVNDSNVEKPSRQ